MTGCLYIEPDMRPALLSDALVTTENYLRKVVPINVNYGLDEMDRYVSILMRKTYVFNSRLALSFSGLLSNIKDYIETLTPLIPYIEGTGSLVETLVRQANEYSDLSILIAYVEELDEDRIQVTSCGAGNGLSRQTRNLGNCSAIGSGATELIETTQRFDQDISDNGRECYGGPQSLIRGLCSAHNIVKMKNELLDVEKESSWGGVLEYVSYDEEAQSWTRGPPTLYIILSVTPVGDGEFTSGLFGRSIAYDPGIDNGRVLTISGEQTSARLHMWRLANVIDDNVEFDSADELEFWKNWRPEAATISLIRNEDNNDGTQSINKSTTMAQRDQIIYSLGEQVEYGLSQELMDELSQEACDVWGVRYIPIREVIGRVG